MHECMRLCDCWMLVAEGDGYCSLDEHTTHLCWERKNTCRLTCTYRGRYSSGMGEHADTTGRRFNDPYDDKVHTAFPFRSWRLGGHV